MWRSVIRPMLGAYTAPRFVVIQDMRVGIPHKVLICVVIAYVLFNIISNQSYLYTETPQGTVAAFSTIVDEVYEENRVQFENGDAVPCANPSVYDFTYSKEFVYDNFTCAFISPEQYTVKDMQGNVFFVTHFTDIRSVTRPKEGEECPNSEDAGLGDNYDLRDANLTLPGTCAYRQQEDYLVPASTEMRFTFLSSYDTSPLIGRNGAAPRTFLRRKGSNENLAEFAPGSDIEASVQDWLDWAGIDLDEQFNDQPVSANNVDDPNFQGVGASAGQFPYVRVTGLKIVLLTSFYNYNLQPGSGGVGTPSSEIVSVVEIDSQLTWTSLGDDVSLMLNSSIDPQILTRENIAIQDEIYTYDRYRYGIQFQFVFGGTMGSFDYNAFINALVQGLVLIGVAGTITSLIAQYMLGTRSQLYRSNMRTDVNFRREYARFTAQALVAASVFASIDKDGTGYLDKAEIFKQLKYVFGASGKRSATLSDDKLAVLAEFLLKESDKVSHGAADLDDHVKDTSLEARRVTMDEWVNIFTDDMTDVTMLSNILKNRKSKLLINMAKVQKELGDDV